MALFVDEARWRWRDLRWAHLISDQSVDELHPIAHEVGLRRMGFQGDHYDVPETLVPALLGLGVEQIPSRQLVVALRMSGLRRAAGIRVGHWEAGGEFGPSPDAAARAVETLTGFREQTEAARVVAEALARAPEVVNQTQVTLLQRNVGVAAVIEPVDVGPAWSELAAHFEVPSVPGEGPDTLSVGDGPADSGSGRRRPIVVVHRRPGARLIEVIGAEP